MSNDYYKGSTELKYYPISSPVNECFRFTDKQSINCDISLVNNYWREQIQLYGQRVDYYVSTFNLLSADALYGEQPTSRYNAPLSIIFGVNLNENALLLSKYGLVSDDEITAFVHMETYYAVFGVSAEPKSGDIFSLIEYGDDRPGTRGPNFYEVTQRLDQDIAQINSLAGHYVWLLKGKRYEYSFEPGLSGEIGNDQVFDDTVAPGVSGATKPYPYNVNEEGQDIFNYSQSPGFDSVYGGY